MCAQDRKCIWCMWEQVLSVQSEQKECDGGWTDWIETDVITGFWTPGIEQLQVALPVDSPAWLHSDPAVGYTEVDKCGIT